MGGVRQWWRVTQGPKCPPAARMHVLFSLPSSTACCRVGPIRCHRSWAVVGACAPATNEPVVFFSGILHDVSLAAASTRPSCHGPAHGRQSCCSCAQPRVFGLWLLPTLPFSRTLSGAHSYRHLGGPSIVDPSRPKAEHDQK